MSNQELANPKRTRTVAPVPSIPLEEALIVAETINEHNAGRPFSRLSLAEALGRSPESSAFRQLVTSSGQWGFTSGSYSAQTIALTELGLKLTKPTDGAERQAAIRQAFLSISIYEKLAQHYDQARIPDPTMLANTLERQFGLDQAKSVVVAGRFSADALFAGVARNIAGSLRVDLLDSTDLPDPNSGMGPSVPPEPNADKATDSVLPETSLLIPSDDDQTVKANNRVFISHGSKLDVVEQLKQILTFGKFVPVVEIENQSTARPVPEKVFNSMRSCSAGVIHVSREKKAITDDGQEISVLNPNVLIEIGGAMALYGPNVVLLVERGVELPSNLQGLYRCNYEGDKLDYDATMKLLQTFNQFYQGK